MSKQNVRTHSHSGATKKLLSSCLVFSVHFLVMFRQVNSSYTSFHTQWADETLWNNNFSLSSVKQNTSIQTANMYKKRLNNRSWVWTGGVHGVAAKTKGVSETELKSSCPSSHCRFPLVICSVWYPAGLTQILWFTHSKLLLLKHFVQSYLNPGIGKLGFILDQEVPASTENTFMW